jgi:hypothetical protein
MRFGHVTDGAVLSPKLRKQAKITCIFPPVLALPCPVKNSISESENKKMVLPQRCGSNLRPSALRLYSFARSNNDAQRSAGSTTSCNRKGVTAEFDFSLLIQITSLRLCGFASQSFLVI